MLPRMSPAVSRQSDSPFRFPDYKDQTQPNQTRDTLPSSSRSRLMLVVIRIRSLLKNESMKTYQLTDMYRNRRKPYYRRRKYSSLLVNHLWKMSDPSEINTNNHYCTLNVPCRLERGHRTASSQVVFRTIQILLPAPPPAFVLEARIEHLLC